MGDKQDYYLAIQGVIGPNQANSGSEYESNRHHGINLTDFAFETTALPGSAPDVGPFTATIYGDADLQVFNAALNSGKPLSGVSVWGQSDPTNTGHHTYDSYLLNLGDVAVTGITQNGDDRSRSYTVSLKPLHNVTVQTRPGDGSDASWVSTSYDIATGKTGIDGSVGVDGEAGTIRAAFGRGMGLRIDDGAFAGLGDTTTYGGSAHHDLIGISSFSFESSADANGSTLGAPSDGRVEVTISGVETMPALLAAFATGRSLGDIALVGLQSTEDGDSTIGYETDLKDARIVSLRQAVGQDDNQVTVEFSFSQVQTRTPGYQPKPDHVTSPPIGLPGPGQTIDANSASTINPHLMNLAAASGSSAPTPNSEPNLVLAIQGMVGSSGSHHGLEIDGYDFAATRPSVGGAVGIGRPDFGAVTFHVASQEGLTSFLSALDKGSAFQEATVYRSNYEGGAHDELSLRNAHVTQIAQDADGGYSVSLTADAIGAGAQVLKPNGDVLSTPHTAYDIHAGTITGALPAAEGLPAQGTPSIVHEYYVRFANISGDATGDHAGEFHLSNFTFNGEASYNPGSGTGRPADYSALTLNLADGDAALPALLAAQAGKNNPGSAQIIGEDAAGRVVYKLDLAQTHFTSVGDADGAGGIAIGLGYNGLSLQTSNSGADGGLTKPVTFADQRITSGEDIATPVGNGDGNYHLAAAGLVGAGSAADHYGLSVDAFSFNNLFEHIAPGNSGAPVTITVANDAGLSYFTHHLQNHDVIGSMTLYGSEGGGSARADTYELTLAGSRVTDIAEENGRYTVTLSPGSVSVQTRPSTDASSPWASASFDSGLGRTFAKPLAPATGVAAGTVPNFDDIHYYVQFATEPKDAVSIASGTQSGFLIDNFTYELSSASEGKGLATSVLSLDLPGDAGLVALESHATSGTALLNAVISGVDSSGHVVSTSTFGAAPGGQGVHIVGLTDSHDGDAALHVQVAFDQVSQTTSLVANAPPIMAGTQAVLTGAIEDTPFHVTTASLLQGFSDPEGGALTIANLSSDAGQVVATSDGFTINPSSDLNGVATLHYSVVDAQGAALAATATYTIAAVNDAPRAPLTPPAALPDGTQDAAYHIAAGDLLAGFTDPENDALSVLKLSVDHGSVSPDGTGDFIITPQAGYAGVERLSYTVSDGHGGYAPTTRSFTIDPVSGTTVTPGGHYDASQGNETFTGPASGYNGSSFTGFGPGDSLTLTNQTIDPLRDVAVMHHSLDLSIDTDHDGKADVSIHLLDPVQNLSLGFTSVGGATTITATALATATDGADRITGSDGIDIIAGQGGDDILGGLDGNDVLLGGAGNDQLNGGTGRDWLDGGVGDDRMTGGSGTDLFVFDESSGATGKDRITDFGPDDLLLSTVKINDSNGDGIINFGRNKVLDLAPGAQVSISNDVGSTLHTLAYDGAVVLSGTTYYVYGALHSSVGLPYLDALGAVAVAH